MNKKLLIFLLLIFSTIKIYSLNTALPEYLRYASDEELLKLAPYFKIYNPSINTIRRELMDMYEDNEVVVSETESNNLKINIEHSDDIKTSGDDYIVLQGDVKLSLSTENAKDDKTINAEKIIIFPKKQFVTAIGNVRVESREREESDKLSGEMMSFLVKDRQFFITNGSSSINRRNSDSKNVNFYAQGENVYYDNSIKAFSLDNGYLSTSKKNRYSSLASSDITMLDGDMFLSNAFLYIGRVPVFYAPFFFYPGKTLSINPGFGYTTDNGNFITTTFEIYGKSRLIEDTKGSSFSTLLKDPKDGQALPDGMFYNSVNDKKLTPTQKWAKDTKSYLALYMDISENKGFSFGLDTKNSFLKNSLNFDLLTLFAFYNNKSDKGSNSLKYDKLFRYAFAPSFKYKSPDFNIDFKGDVYSDPYVLKHYTNRITSFSFDSFFKTLETPSKASTKNKSTWSLKLDGNLPKISKNNRTNQIRKLNFEIDSEFNNDLKKYELKSITTPEFDFSFDSKLYERSETKKVDGVKVERAKNIKSVKEADIYLYETSGIQSRSNSYHTNLHFRYDTNFKLRYDYDKTKVRSYNLRALNVGEFSNSFSLSKHVKFDHSLKFSFDQNDLNTSRDVVNKVIYSLTFKLPTIGFSYNFSDIVLTNKEYFRRLDYKDKFKKKREDLTLSTFKKETILKHNAKLSNTYKTDHTTWTFALDSNLPPLNFTVNPSLSFTILKDFKSNNSSYFANDSNKDLKFKSFNSNNSYSYKDIFRINYDYKLSKNDDKLTHHHSSGLSLGFLDRKLVLGQKLDYTQGKTMSLVSYFNTPYLDISYSAKVDENNKYLPRHLRFKIREKKVEFRLWKNRIKWDLALTGRLDVDLQYGGNSSLEVGFKTNFKIAEFCDLSFSIGSLNRGFARYMKFGKFSYKEMFKDFARSFDFAGKGRYHTQFVLNHIKIDFTHYMYDWILKVNYNLSLSDDSSSSFKGKTTVFLQWNSIPELKIDQKFK